MASLLVVDDDGILKEQSVNALHHKVAYLEGRVDEFSNAVSGLHESIDRLDRRFDALDTKIDSRFWTLLGIQVTTLLAIVGGLFGVVTGLVRP